MKRQILSLATAMALTAGGAIFAQSTLNTTAPGPSQEGKPGQTNNNLQNPGNPQNQRQDNVVRENGTQEGTAAESNARTGQTGTTGTTGTMDNTTGTTGTTGTMNNMDQTGTGTTGTGSMGTTGNGAYNNGTTGSTTTTGGSMDNTDTSATNGRLPNTASDLPTLALMGLLALSAVFALRIYAKRQA